MCDARRHSDQMLCGRCALAWDVNDPEPPECRPAPVPINHQVPAVWRRNNARLRANLKDVK